MKSHIWNRSGVKPLDGIVFSILCSLKTTIIKSTNTQDWFKKNEDQLKNKINDWVHNSLGKEYFISKIELRNDKELVIDFSVDADDLPDRKTIVDSINMFLPYFEHSLASFLEEIKAGQELENIKWIPNPLLIHLPTMDEKHHISKVSKLVAYSVSLLSVTIFLFLASKMLGYIDLPVKDMAGYKFLTVIAIIIGAFLLLIGLFMIVYSVGKRNTADKLGIALSLGGVSLLSGASLFSATFKIDHIIDHIYDIQQQCAEIQFSSNKELIGPFVEGSHSEIVSYSSNSIPEVAQRIQSRIDHDSLDLALVIGRVDKKPLKTRLDNIYGSNEGLAYARAVYTLARLSRISNAIKTRNNKFVISTGGPMHIGSNVSDDDRIEDRYVDIYLFWHNRQKK